jgi:hypothetical protein
MDFLHARRTRLSTAGSSSAAVAAEVSFGEVPVVYKQVSTGVSAYIMLTCAPPTMASM